MLFCNGVKDKLIVMFVGEMFLVDLVVIGNMLEFMGLVVGLIVLVCEWCELYVVFDCVVVVGIYLFYMVSF